MYKRQMQNDELFSEVEQYMRKQIKQNNENDLSQGVSDTEEMFDSSQIQSICRTLKGFEDYPRIVSMQINHHQTSIASLPQHIRQMFPELQTRTNQCIWRAKANIQMIKIMMAPYQMMYMKHIKTQKASLGNNCQQSHEHSHSQSMNHSKLINLFHHMVRQWSDYPEIDYIQRVIEGVKEFQIGQQTTRSHKGQKTSLLVIGCGMGRILRQLNVSFGRDGWLIQGHEAQSQTYICADYFLNRCQQQNQIYPYIHNFSNFSTQTDPYRRIKIPSLQLRQSYNYKLTLGDFCKLYRNHKQNWTIIISSFNNYHIVDVLDYVRVVYNVLEKGGLWIDVSTACMDGGVVVMSYKEYENILDKSQFKLIVKNNFQSYWYHDKNCMMNQKRTIYYRVMRK